MASEKIIEKHIVPTLVEKIRLQEYAAKIFINIPSRSGLKRALKKELVLLNGKVAKTSDWMEEGQVLELLEEIAPKKKTFNLKLEVVFEDEYLALIYKPSGYPTNGNYFKTIENTLPFNLKNSSEKDALPKPVPVHRLDNPTSGLLLIAKTKTTQVQLHTAFEKREIQKSYVAIVSGSMQKKGSFTSAIDGKPAITEFEVLKEFLMNGKLFCLVELSPITGRTHQLRIHLSTNKNPIVGDLDYGSSEKVKGILLTARSLAFTHPVTKEKLRFENEIPKKFEKFLKRG